MKTDQPTGAAAADETYVLGRSEAETRRLILQGRFQNPFTKRLLEDAGIAPGMKVLDAGSGAGDVALIAAELVGPRGSVLGVDMNPAVLGVARERVRKAGLRNVAFVEADLGSPKLGEGFDAVVGRFVLMYQPDPARTLGALAGRVCPGGIVAFQEMNLHPESSWFSPPTPLWRRFWGWSQALGPKTGMESEMGYKLHRAYLDSGLPAPAMQLEAMVGGGPEWGGYEYAAQTLRSLLPLMVRLGVVTEEEVEIDTLAGRLREETVAAGGVVKMPEVVSAWAIKP